MVNNKGLLEKVDFLLSMSKSGKCTNEELAEVKEMTGEHSEHAVLGRFMGYSVSDYAIATLKWIGTDEARKEFDSLFSKLSHIRKQEVSDLISKELYLQY